MTTRVARIMTVCAAVAAIVAIAVPSALAAPRSSWTNNHPLYPGTQTQSLAVTTGPPNLPYTDHSVLRFQRVAAYHSGGFDWTAAGIGALAAAGACVVLFGVTVDVRRRRHPTMA